MSRYLCGYKYVLVDNFEIDIEIKEFEIDTRYFKLSKTGMLTVKTGYAFDGLTHFPDYEHMMKGALIHDVLYQMIRESYLPLEYRKHADKKLKVMLKEAGVDILTRNMIFRAVRLFGERYVLTNQNKVKKL